MALRIPQQGCLSQAPRAVVDPDPADEALHPGEVGEPLVDLRQLLAAAGDLTGDLAGGIWAWLCHRAPYLYGPRRFDQIE